MVVTRDANDVITVYFDGQPVFSAVSGSWSSLGKDILHFFHQPPIPSSGSCNLLTPQPLPAALARVRILTVALTADEVAALNSDGIPPVVTYPTSDILCNAQMQDLVPAASIYPAQLLFPPILTTYEESGGSAYQLNILTGNQGYTIPLGTRLTNARAFTVSMVLNLNDLQPDQLVSLLEFANVADLNPASAACVAVANTTMAPGFYLFQSRFQYYEAGANYRDDAIDDPSGVYALTTSSVSPAFFQLVIVRNQTDLQLYYNGAPFGDWTTSSNLLQANVLRVFSEPCGRGAGGIVARIRTFNYALSGDAVAMMTDDLLPPTPSADVDFQLQNTFGANMPLRSDVNSSNVGSAYALSLQPFTFYIGSSLYALQTAANATQPAASSQLFVVETIENGRERFVLSYGPGNGVAFLPRQLNTVHSFSISMLFSSDENEQLSSIFYVNVDDPGYPADGCYSGWTPPAPGQGVPPPSSSTAYPAPALWLQQQHLHFIYYSEGVPVRPDTEQRCGLQRLRVPHSNRSGRGQQLGHRGRLGHRLPVHHRLLAHLGRPAHMVQSLRRGL